MTIIGDLQNKWYNFNKFRANTNINRCYLEKRITFQSREHLVFVMMDPALCVFVSKCLILSLQEQLVTWEQVPLSEKSILMWKLTRDPRKPGTSDQLLFHRGGTCTAEKKSARRDLGFHTGYSVGLSFVDGLK